MSNLIRTLRGGSKRSGDPLDFGTWLSYFQYNGVGYSGGLNTTYGNGEYENIPSDFRGYVEAIYKQNGVVFACMAARMMPFSEARFQYRRLRSGRPGEYFGNRDLAVLETPWPNGTTGDLLRRMIQDADLSGNAFVYRSSLQSDRLVRMAPDWTTIVLGSPNPAVEVYAGDLDAEVVGYIYQPGGPSSGREPVALLRDQVAHFAPNPDPCATYRGMSWLTPVLREIVSDGAATTHKLKFFEQGATPNMVVSLDASIQKEAFEAWVEKMDAEHAGVLNAYKTMYLGGGSQVQVVGRDMQQLDFKNVQGAGETRIAAAAGIPPVIVGLSEGLAAATYSNYSQARRRYADGTLRPMWRDAAASLSTLVKVPAGAQLWYDDRDIPFLAEDLKDQAEVQQMQAAAIGTLVTAGYDPSTIIDAIVAGDIGRLAHTGLVSVQLLPPGSPGPAAAPAAAPANGNGKPAPAPATAKALISSGPTRSLRAREQAQLEHWAEANDVALWDDER